MHLSLEFSPTEYAEFTALYERIRTQHPGVKREALRLKALEALAHKKSSRLDPHLPYRVVVRQRPACETATIPSPEGDRTEGAIRWIT